MYTQILSVAISPVYNRIASGGDDGKLYVVDAITGDLKFSRDAHKYWIRCVRYSPDGTMIATCSDDRTISIWDADNGNCLLGPVDCGAGAVLSIAFSPNGKILISGKTELRLRFSSILRVCSGNDDTTVRSWTLDAHTSDKKLSPLSTYSGHISPVKTVSYAHSGERIVSGSEDAEIAVWEGGDSNKLVWKIRGHDGPILSIAVSGEEIFSSSEDQTIRVWALDTGVRRIVIHGHTAPINAIRLSPDGQWVVSASDDARLRIWDARTGESRRLPQTMSSRIFSVTVSRDSKQIVCGGADGQVHVWRPDMGQPAVWPDSFVRMVHGLEYCPLDDQGILANATLRRDGWLYGSTGEALCWIPPDHRPGLLQRAVGVLGAPETALDVRKFVHGTDWERCATHYLGAWASQSHQMLQILLS